MNSHRKLAIFVVPFLLIGGFIASDFYIEHQADQTRIFQLQPFEGCDVINQKCILKSGELEMNVYDEDGLTKINSSFPLDSVTLFLVGEKESIEHYPLGMTESPYYWQSPTKLRSAIPNKGSQYLLRVIAKIKGGQYISEFYTKTSK